VLELLPESEVKVGVHRALELAGNSDVAEVSELLGNGSEITAQDTVPFALWCAARYLNNYEEALWATVSALGDRDTTCAIVGGIVASYTGLAGLPVSWRNYREPLPEWAF
jgi:ADP-ribosylglycohydrolase